MKRLLLLLLAAWIHLVASTFGSVAEAAPCPPDLHGTWAVDGVYGPYTTRAVTDFQRAHGLTADGVAGPRTLAALGWGRTPIVLKCGASGTTVQRLQMSLSKAGYWWIEPARRATPVAAATPSPSARPTRPATPRVVPPAATPRPSPAPSAKPTAPTPSPSATPAPQVVVPLSPEPFVTVPAMTPSLVEASAGMWLNTALSPLGDTTFNAALPSWTYSATLWHGAFGVGGEVVRFNPAGGAVTPVRFFQGNTALWDAGLKWRFDDGRTALSAGYRMLDQARLDFITLGLASRRPLAGDWLSFDARGLLGGNGSGGYTIDGQTGLSLQWRPVSLSLGYRYMLVSRLRAAEPVYVTSGPSAALTLGF